jgi:hypothetical protein
MGFRGSGISSRWSMNPKMRSAEAMADCIMLYFSEISWMGLKNIRI